MSRAELPKGERRLLDVIERCDFTGKGCYPTQKELTFLTGFKNHRYTNRLVKNLERKGFLTIEKRRRPGCKWFHNVYHVETWNPQVRRGICNLRREWPRVRAEQESSSAESGLEREATPSRAQNAVARPQTRALTPRCYAVGEPSAVVARRGIEIQNLRGRRYRMAEPLRLPVDCEECARKDRIIRQYAENHSKLVEEVSGAQETARAAGKEITTLKRKITRQANEDAEAEQIQRLLEDWQRDHPRAQIPAGGRRWEVAKRALRLMRDAEPSPVDACLEALEGLRLRPYQEFEKRYATPGGKRVLRNDVEHALGDENRIERCRAYARWARSTEPEKRWWFYELASQVSEVYFARAVEALEGSEMTGGCDG